MKETTFPTREALLEHFDEIERNDPFDAGRLAALLVLDSIRALALTPGQPLKAVTAMVERAVLNLQEDFPRLEGTLNSGTQDIIARTHATSLKVDGTAVLTYQEAVFRTASQFIAFLVFETYGRAAAAGFDSESPDASDRINRVFASIRQFETLDFCLPEVVKVVAEWNKWGRKDKEPFLDVYSEIEIGLYREWLAVSSLPPAKRKIKPRGPKLTQSKPAKAVQKLLAKNPNLTADQLTDTIDDLSAAAARKYTQEYFEAYPDKRPSSRPKKSKSRKV